MQFLVLDFSYVVRLQNFIVEIPQSYNHILYNNNAAKRSGAVFPLAVRHLMSYGEDGKARLGGGRGAAQMSSRCYLFLFGQV